MLPVRLILHPTDFSERSERALHLAGALARDYPSRQLFLGPPMIPPHNPPRRKVRGGYSGPRSLV